MMVSMGGERRNEGLGGESKQWGWGGGLRRLAEREQGALLQVQFALRVEAAVE